ncbi:MAG: hypothetical protein Q4F97_02695 [Bacteroidales bacterium]|nr:hypothetical protein [Bacteroidales bacterium]
MGIFSFTKYFKRSPLKKFSFFGITFDYAVNSILIIVMIFGLNFVGVSQPLSLNEANLKGKVKSVKVQHQKVFNENDSIWGEVPPDNDPFWFDGCIDTYSVFDKDGNLIEYHTYFTNGADDNETKNVYDEDGRLAYQNFYSDKIKTGTLKYSYDEIDRIIAIERFDENDIIQDRVVHIRNHYQKIPLGDGHNNVYVYKYNSKGECIEERSLLPDGEINYRNMYFYDDNSRQNRIVSFDKKNTMLATVGYKYDKKGRISSATKITSLKKSVVSFKYDYENNVVLTISEEINMEELRDSNKKINKSVERTSSYYEYDDNGNWIFRLFKVEKEPKFIQVREIKYYH